ncbi:MAG TPA: chromosome segregation protein SMC, partial [Methanobacteriaceae archaeon]|nr:chromosome segregation protein SMC [Methanobacteriaceae archaeon]
MDLLDDTGLCPLCETSWEPAQLKEHLEENLHRYQEAKDDLNRLDLLSNEIIDCINRLKNSLDEVKKARKEWKLVDNYLELDVWGAELDKLSEKIGDNDSGKIDLHVPENLSQIVGELLEISKNKSSPPSSEQTSWDHLTRLEENLKNLEIAQEDCKIQYGSYQRAEILLQAFEDSRKEVLNELYSDIKDRFVELYRELHGIDEAEFEAALTSAGAGIDFQVDFHGRGEHPPHALHSEGHQDSMGICLYLALAERLTQGYIDLIILDDVMMSVDAPHRRRICHLLADFFKGKQFFITTHDRIWA